MIKANIVAAINQTLASCQCQVGLTKYQKTNVNMNLTQNQWGKGTIKTNKYTILKCCSSNYYVIKLGITGHKFHTRNLHLWKNVFTTTANISSTCNSTIWNCKVQVHFAMYRFTMCSNCLPHASTYMAKKCSILLDDIFPNI